ncbi:MAG: phenylacetate-CoA oxygenase subunit PaaJ [Chitinophagaceae bacterium]|nr:MAG: phenylacetate-CoA oxygenase subunit PaaJ [Chitinophagaceae bacterium]
MVSHSPYETSKIRDILSQVMDPEIPVLSIIDLGVLREIRVENSQVHVVITPTYSGCPAMEMIAANIRMELMAGGYSNPEVVQQLDPAWTTDWMTESGKAKLKEYGIAPPPAAHHKSCTDLFAEESVQCPHCNSWHTGRISEFGSTACKSLYKCEDCLEPFDYFKCH